MIKELIFSGKKYFEGQTPNYIGKTLKGAGTNKVEGATVDYDFRSNEAVWSSAYREIPANSLNGRKIYGQAIDDFNFVCVLMPYYYNGNTYMEWFRVSELTENGGVSHSPLIHLYQGLRHLLNRKVAYVFD